MGRPVPALAARAFGIPHRSDVSRGQGHRINLFRQPKGRVRTAIVGVSYLFCLGMVRPDGPSDPISGRDGKWEFVNEQSPMNRLSLSALGPILIPPKETGNVPDVTVDAFKLLFNE